MLDLLLHGVGSYAPGALVGPARWPHYDLIVVVEGSLALSIGRRTVECVAGDACLISPRSAFRGSAGVGGATIWVQHFAVGNTKSKDGIILPRKSVRWAGVGQWEWPRTLMWRLSRRQKSQAADRVAGLLLELLLEEFQTARPVERGGPAGAKKNVQMAIEWIESHALPLPSVKEIASFAGWSVNYFRDQFRVVSGRPVGEFLKQRRMGEAARLLVETRRPIKEIAGEAGYADAAAFHRAFQDRYKVTPGQYRDQRVPMV